MRFARSWYPVVNTPYFIFRASPQVSQMMAGARNAKSSDAVALRSDFLPLTSTARAVVIASQGMANAFTRKAAA